MIPAGPFEMGCDSDTALFECQKLFEPFSSHNCQRKWFDGEEPVHTADLDAFYIDVYEVTNARYAACVDAGACDSPSSRGSYSRSSYYGNPEYDAYPVTYVRWEDARNYCAWRGVRLPTEAEWEKAARGGLEGALYPWGDTFDGSRANFCDSNCSLEWANTNFDDGYVDTAPVGSYAPNGYGVYDMVGNVWEWVADWYDDNYYSSSPASNPSGPTSGKYRVMRGGGWDHDGSLLRVAFRYYPEPFFELYFSGFRCARTP
jgi:formylglycine-generating enzyme required for sulfatase activity